MNIENRDYDHLLRFILLGDFQVGKTALLNFLVNGSEPASIGLNFRCKTLSSYNQNICIQLWDSEGQERFQGISNYYFQRTNAVLLVYDITSRASFSDIKQFWIKEVEQHAGNGVQMALIGNKYDLREERAVPIQEAITFANEHGMIFLQGSAKTGQNLEDLLSLLTDNVVRELENTEGKQQQMSKICLRSGVLGKGKTRSNCF